MDWPPVRRYAPVPEGIAQRQHRGHRPTLFGWHAEQLCDFVRLVPQYRCDDATHALCSSGEQGTPDRRIDVRPTVIVDGEREQKKGNLGEVLGEVVTRCLDLAQ